MDFGQAYPRVDSGANKPNVTDELHVRGLLDRIVGENHDREGLQDTPKRYLAALDHWTQGYQQDPAAILKTFEDGAQDYDQLVFQGAIPLFSTCEHHITPFFGVAHVGYIPNKRILGLSKILRVVDIFARRLQVQERLTRQIAEAINEHLKPRAVGVVLRCRHLCIESRGVAKSGSMTYTSALYGDFRTEPESRAEFLRFVDRADVQASV